MSALVALAITGCEEPEVIGDPEISLDKIELAFSQEKASETLTFKSNREWKVNMDTVAMDWINVDPSSGQASDEEVTVTVTVTENTGCNRSATIEFYAGLVSAIVTVNQEGAKGDSIVTYDLLTVAEFIEKADEKTAYKLKGVVKGFSADYCSFNLKDDSGQIYVYSVADGMQDIWGDQIANGDTIEIAGYYKFYEDKSQDEVVKATILALNKYQGGQEEVSAIYFNNFDKEAAVQTNSKWPYADASDCWKNAQGTGANDTTFAAATITVRSNSTSDGSYSVYDGSGTNNLFFGTSSYFAVGNINLGGQTNFKLSFGTEEYDNNNKDAAFDLSAFHLYVSADGKKWVELKYSFPNGAPTAKWDLAETSFSVPAGTEVLYIGFVPDVASVFRLDDLKLETASSAGTEVDFANGVTTSISAAFGGNEEGEGGGEEEDNPSVTANRADLETLNNGTAKTSYSSYKSEAGWALENGCVQTGGTTDNNPTFTFIGKTGETWNMAACINGKTSAVGSLTSPTITGGVGTLTFNYAHAFNEKDNNDETKGGCKVQIDFIKDGNVAKTVTLEKTSAEMVQKTAYTAEFEVNVTGPCSIKFTNLSPSQSTSNKDRVSLWNISWTDCK